MLKVNLKDGRTLRFDLNDLKSARDWSDRVKNHSFQEQITGLTIDLNGVSYSLPRPKDFEGGIFLFGDIIKPNMEKRIKGGESILCTAGDIQVSITAYSSQRSARIDVSRPGKQMFNPLQGSYI